MTTMRLLPASGSIQDYLDEISDCLAAENSGGALRQLTYMTKLIKDNFPRIPSAALEESPIMPAGEWGTFIKAYIRHELGECAPDWTTGTQTLAAPWYPTDFRSMRARADATTPSYLRALNIFIPEKSLQRA